MGSCYVFLTHDYRALSRESQGPKQRPAVPAAIPTAPAGGSDPAFPLPRLHQPPAASGENRRHDAKGAERTGCKCILFVCGKQDWGKEKIYFRHYEMF